MDIPQTHYAETLDGFDIAYQVFVFSIAYLPLSSSPTSFALRRERLVWATTGGRLFSTAARVAAKAKSSEVLASSTVKDLVAGSALSFVERGSHALKGVPGRWKLFACRQV